MKYKLQAFFASRNGLDDLAKVILWSSLIVMLLSSFIGVSWLRVIVYYVSLAALCYSYFRVFSRRSDKLAAQNARYVTWRRYRKMRFQQRKTHRFYRCPKCRQVLRVPKGSGKIKITCTGCGEQFIKNA